MRMNHKSVLGRAVAVATASVIFLPATAFAASPGAPGIGDPYFPDYGNGGYDASHYDVDVAVDGATLAGTTTMTATATQSLSRFDLDFVLKTTSVTVNGEPATFTHDTVHELVVTPAKAIKNGAEMTVVVTYSDQPGSVYDRGINPVYSTNPGLLILGEPEAAAWWMATNDHPRDKATYDLAITVPNDQQAISAGTHTGTDHHGATDTWHWKVSQPTTGYLVFLAAGHYDVTTSEVGGLPTTTAIADGTGSAGTAAKADFDRLNEVVTFLESQFGTYHFDAHGNVVPNVGVGFALENQTRPVYSPNFWSGGRSNIGVVVHETAHQWFGDNVSVHNWRDVWLNEGFASWAEWRWEEAQGGSTANELLMAYYNYYPAGDAFWTVKIGDPGASRIFSGPVYDRGAMTVQALRNRIGNKDVRKVFRKWERKHEYNDGSIHQFQKLATKVSGQNLDSFFTNWLYTPTKPAMTKKNGLKGFPGADAVSTITAQDIPAWDRLQETRQAIIDAERTAHGG